MKERRARREGLARDLIRAVQDTRKAAGFDVSDRITLTVLFDHPGDGEFVARAFEVAGVASETLALAYRLTTRTGELLASGDVTEPEFEAVVAAKTYANVGALTIGVARIGAAS